MDSVEKGIEDMKYEHIKRSMFDLFKYADKNIIEADRLVDIIDKPWQDIEEVINRYDDMFFERCGYVILMSWKYKKELAA